MDDEDGKLALMLCWKNAYLIILVSSIYAPPSTSPYGKQLCRYLVLYAQEQDLEQGFIDEAQSCRSETPRSSQSEQFGIEIGSERSGSSPQEAQSPELLCEQLFGYWICRIHESCCSACRITKSRQSSNNIEPGDTAKASQGQAEILIPRP